MEKNMTLQNSGLQTAHLIQHLKNMACAPLDALGNYYSDILERPVGRRHTALLLNAQVAFLLAVFPTDGPLLLRAVCCGWFAHAVLQCRNALQA